MGTIKRGSKVEDLVSGFQGIVTATIECSNGNIRCAVTPRTNDPTVKADAVTFDIKQLRKMRGGVESTAQPTAKHTAKMWDKIKDRVTGDAGTVVGIHIFLNGCVHYEAERSDYNRDRHTDTYFIVESHRTEVTGAMEAPKTKPTGGPVRRAPVMSGSGRVTGRGA